MNRAQAMQQLGDTLGVAPIPSSIGGLVAALGGTRAAAALMPGDAKLSSKQRTLQRYQRAEAGERGKNVRGASEAARSRLTGDLRSAVAAREKATALAKRPRGFHAKVTGNFFKSYVQRGRTVKPVYIPREDMEAIIDEIQAGDYAGAASAFDDAYGNSYDVAGMQWGEPSDNDSDYDAFNSLEID